MDFNFAWCAVERVIAVVVATLIMCLAAVRFSVVRTITHYAQ